MRKKISTNQKGRKVKDSGSSPARKNFTEPKLKFIEPKLIKRGDATRITAGFFESFTP